MSLNNKQSKLADFSFARLSKKDLSTVMGGNTDTKEHKDKNDCGQNNQKNRPVTSPIVPDGTPLDLSGCPKG